MTHQFHPTSLREYDIRGIVGETLGEADAYALLRTTAMNQNRRMVDIAQSLVTAADLLGP